MRAHQILLERSRRALLFPHIGEPAWLILLDLYISEEVDTSVTSACLASFVPQTTALRYIDALEADGLIEREADPQDRRRVYLRLTSEARERLGGFFAQLPTPEHNPGRNPPEGFTRPRAEPVRANCRPGCDALPAGAAPVSPTSFHAAENARA